MIFIFLYGGRSTLMDIHSNFLYDFCFVGRAILREIDASLSLSQCSSAVCVRVCSV